MAEFKFYFNNEEWRDLFDYLQKNDNQIIPDIFYDSEQFHTISSLTEFLDYQQYKTTHFFLTNQFFSLEPLVVGLNKYTNEPKFQVNQRTGGPYLDISYYRGFADDAIIPYKASYLSFYPNFIHFNSSNEFKASDELKAHYNNIVSFIKKKCQVIKKGDKTYFIGIGVLDEIKILL